MKLMRLFVVKTQQDGYTYGRLNATTQAGTGFMELFLDVQLVSTMNSDGKCGHRLYGVTFGWTGTDSNGASSVVIRVITQRKRYLRAVEAFMELFLGSQKQTQLDSEICLKSPCFVVVIALSCIS